MSTTDDGAVVPELTYEELDLDVIRPRARTLRLNGHAYPVPPALTVPMMAELLELEQGIREASRDPDEPGEDASAEEWERYDLIVSDNRRKAVAAINRAHQAIEDLLQSETPGARIQLDVNEIMLVIRWLVQNRQGATGAVVAAIQDAGGSGQPGTDEEPEGEASPPEQEATAPGSPSRRPSSRRSSGTAGRRNSSRAGGEDADGTTSGSASASLAAV